MFEVLILFFISYFFIDNILTQYYPKCNTSYTKISLFLLLLSANDTKLFKNKKEA